MMAPDLPVDLDRGVFRVVLLLGEVPPEKDLLFLLAEGHGPQLLAHAPLADHPVGDLGGALDVVAGARGHVVKDQLLRDPPAEQDGDVVEEILFVLAVPLVHGKLLGQTQRHPARDDGHLVDRVRTRQKHRHQRVAGLVIGRVPLLLVADDHALALGPHHDFVLGQLKVAHVDLVLVIPRRKERRLVDQVLEIRSGKSRRSPGPAPGYPRRSPTAPAGCAPAGCLRVP